MRIALGVEAFGLDDFAVLMDAQTFKSWGVLHSLNKLRAFGREPDTLFFWNLTGLDVAGGLLGAVSRTWITYTNDELLEFRQRPDWCDRTSWWIDGNEVQRPVEMR